MRRSYFLATLVCMLGASLAPARAQDLPPGHPTVGEPAPAPELPPDHPQAGAPEAPQGELPPGHPQVGAPPAPQGELPPGHPQVGPTAEGGDGAMDATIERAFREPRVATASPSASVPAGNIRVRVVDETGAPLAEQGVTLGVMRQGGDRERTPGLTDADGIFTFTNLPTGMGQAYRVNVTRDGATYSCTPFQLPTGVGYDVRVEARPTVRSDRNLLLVLGQTMVELREERLHIVQQARLSNLAATTYLFPEGGTRIELPEGYTAFQTQPVMTDQRVVEIAGEGVRIEGSLPTGQVTLAWAFDLPVTGEEMEIGIPNPFRTFQYRVISTAPQGMGLEVDDMPTPVRFEDQGQPLLGTEVQRSPEEPALSMVRIRLRGIPGPGPARWVALAVTSLLVLLGAALVVRRGRSDGGSAFRAVRQKELVAEAAKLDRDLEAGEVGPEHRQSRHAAIVRELAVLLYQEERAGGSAGGKTRSSSTKERGQSNDAAERTKDVTAGEPS